MRAKALLVLCVLLALSGCLGGMDTDHAVVIVNEDDRNHTVSATLTDGDETVFQQMTVLEPNHRYTESIERPGNYTLLVTTDHGETRTAYELPMTRENQRSSAIVRIHENGTLTVSIERTGNPLF